MGEGRERFDTYGQQLDRFALQLQSERLQQLATDPRVRPQLERFARDTAQVLTDEQINAALDAVTPAEWAALDDDLRDLEQTDPHVAAAARAYEEMAERITGDDGTALSAALMAATIEELVRNRSRALALHKYGAVERIENEIDRRHQAAAREQWSTPKVGAKPNRRRR